LPSIGGGEADELLIAIMEKLFEYALLEELQSG